MVNHGVVNHGQSRIKYMLYVQCATDPSVALFYQINIKISIKIDTNINIYIITKITMINKDNTNINTKINMMLSYAVITQYP